MGTMQGSQQGVPEFLGHFNADKKNSICNQELRMRVVRIPLSPPRIQIGQFKEVQERPQKTVLARAKAVFLYSGVQYCPAAASKNRGWITDELTLCLEPSPDSPV